MGLVNRAVPREELDAVVDAWVESLVRKLPQTTRYAKQQLNVWRDLAWHQTVGHARDWLSLSMLGDEAQGAIKAFLDSREKPDVDGLTASDRSAGPRPPRDSRSRTPGRGRLRHGRRGAHEP